MDNILTAQLLAAQEASVFYTDIKSENRLQIDWETRSIIVPEDMRIIGVQFDHLANKVTFEMDRYLDGVDLSEHTIAVHFINAGEWFGADRDYSDAGSGVYPITSIDLSTEGKLICEWDVSNAATQIAGIVAFALHIYTIVDGAYTYHLGTKPAVTELPGSINSTEHGSNVVPPEVEVYIQQMQDLSDEIDQSIRDFTADMDAKLAEAEALTERAEAAAEKLVIDDALSFNSENAVQNKLIAPVLDSLDRHKASAIIQSSSGKVIPINGSAKARFPGIRQFGGSEQETYKGYNLIKNTATSQTINGVTFTVNNDGSVTVNGTATGGAAILKVGTITMKSGVTYVCDSDVTNIQFSLRKIGTAVVVYSFYSGVEYTATEDIEYDVYIRVGTGLTVSNVTVYPMIRLASVEDGTYEPYTGNAPSPSPEYPQQIVNAGQMLCEGWQLFDADTVTNNAELDTTTGAVITDNPDTYAVSDFIPVKSGASYYIPTPNSSKMCLYDASKNFVSTFTRNNSVYTATQDGYIRLSFINIDFKTYMLNSGTEAKPWEPYTGGVEKVVDIPIETEVCGKNLLKNTITTRTVNGVTFTVDEDGSVTANGTATAIAYIAIPITLEPNKKYVLNGCPAGGSDAAYKLYAMESVEYSIQYDDYGSGIVFDTSKYTKWSIRARIASGATVSNLVFKPMLRWADIEDDNYEPYHKQPLTYTKEGGFPGIEVTDASLATYTDEDGKMWCADYRDWERGVDVKRVMEEIISAERITAAYGATEEGVTVQGTLSQKHLGYEYCNTMMCDMFQISHNVKGGNWNKYDNTICLGGTANERLQLSLAHDIATSLAEFKEFLGDRMFKIQYILATPIETPIPEEELAAYRALHSNYPNTTIFSDVHTEVETVMDTQMYIDKNAELAAAEVREEVLTRMNTMVDTVTQKTCILGIENGLLTIREA